MGKRIYSSADEVLSLLRAETPPNPLGVDPSRHEYEWVDWGDDDGGRIMPSWNSPFFSPFLYRGQVKRYKPCRPSIYRGLPLLRSPGELSEEQRDSFLLKQCRIGEFCSFIGRHPASRFAAEIGLHLNRVALAQHYEVPTELLDLTADPEVAGFFATCWRDEGGEWHPETEGTGVMYRFDLTAFPRALGDDCSVDDLFRCIELVGLQSLPRPGEQKAWTIRLPLGLDFECLPLDAYKFSHSSSPGEAMMAKFDGGRLLFPPDVVADVAEAIRGGPTLAASVVEQTLLDFGCSFASLPDAVTHYSHRFEGLGVPVSNRDPIRMSEAQRRLAESQFSARSDGFLARVGVRGVKITSVAGLVEMLKNKRPGNRALAAKQLGEFGPEASEALRALTAALDDDNEEVRQQAGRAIQAIRCDRSRT